MRLAGTFKFGCVKSLPGRYRSSRQREGVATPLYLRALSRFRVRFAKAIQQFLPPVGAIRADPQENLAVADRRAGIGIGAKLIFCDQNACPR